MKKIDSLGYNLNVAHSGENEYLKKDSDIYKNMRRETLAKYYGDAEKVTKEERRQQQYKHLFYSIFELIMVGLATLLIMNYTTDEVNIFILKAGSFR